MGTIRQEIKNKRTKLVDVVPLSQPYIIMIDPCGACNFNCVFCPCNNNLNNAVERHKILSINSFDRIVNDIAQFPEKIKAIDMYGYGEPLLNRNLPEMIRHLRDANVCEKIRIATNGSLLTHQMSEELVESGLDYAKISIEGLSDDQYRRVCGVDVSFDEIVENIRYFHEISRGKVEIGAKIISASFESEEDKQKYINIFSPISDYHFIESIKNIWPDFNEFVQLEGDVTDDYYSNHAENYKICAYCLTNMMIHSNGDIGVCCHDWNHATAYENIESISLKDAWNSVQLRDFQIKHMEGMHGGIKFCEECSQVSYDNVDLDAEIICKKLKVF